MPTRADLERLGSSPLARGLHPVNLHLADGRGIIPARAGFTTPAAPITTRWTDHPRSRGVYSARAAMAACTAGSSPLARGLHWPVMRVPHATGIIPARAGFTG